MKVVSNTTPIFSLASVNSLSLLPKIFGKVYLPVAVYQEIQQHAMFDCQEIESENFPVMEITDKEISSPFLLSLDRGETEAILLAKEIHSDFLIIDERAGYEIAKMYGINAIGTLTVLETAKRMGMIKQVRPLLDEMILKGRWYSRTLYQEFLRKIGEL